ncbi:hypothetical protein L596_028960 [Steinernema carpocapsae]|uniref:OTU domain-containing protein n=1 Tax=Steinernema carpocapsae TaxID=34508 RepID=A0A4U5LT80_STECR|nr:hypothetical protein L596_028960 [Steinernema carpocapsae]
MPARIDWENAGVKKIINEARSKKLSHRDAAQLLSPIVGYHVSHATIGKFLRRKNNNRFGVHAKPSVVGRVRGDGHCGFRSLAQCIFGPGNDEHIYLALRKHICDYLSALKAPYPIWYEIFKPRISMIMHLEKMRTNAWMTSLELQAAATLLDINISVFAADQRSPCWVIYRSDHSGESSNVHCLMRNIPDHFDPVFRV